MGLKATKRAFSDLELRNLRKQLSEEELAIEKMKMYEHQVEQDDLRKIIASLKEKHQQHYDLLNRQLESETFH